MALLRPKAQTHTSGWVGECKSCSLDSLQQSVLVNHVNHQKNFSKKFKGKIFWIPGDPLWSNGQHRRLGIRRSEVRISPSPKYFSWFITIILRHGLSLSFFPDVDKGEAEWRTKGEVEWKKDWKQQDSTQLQVAPSNINCNIYRYD